MRATREAAGPDAQLFVDAGASDAYWPQKLKWALNTAQMLRDYDVGWFEDLQLAAALPHCDLVEFIGGSAYVDDTVAEPFILDDEGKLHIPDRPGLGVDLDPEALARFTHTPASLFAAE